MEIDKNATGNVEENTVGVNFIASQKNRNRARNTGGNIINRSNKGPSLFSAICATASRRMGCIDHSSGTNMYISVGGDIFLVSPKSQV